jgi:Icc-related predicted phosphoesterase
MLTEKIIRILSVSDVVTPIDEIKNDARMAQGIDLILSCGDLPPEFLTSLTVACNVPLFYVCGNHDIRYIDKKPQGCTDIHKRIVHVCGLKIMGLEGSIWYNGGPYQYKESEMRSMIRQMRFPLWMNKGVDLVISHAPPRDIHDRPDPCHVGFSGFRSLIEKYQPAYFVHGHIHQEFSDPLERITIAGKTKVVNTYGFFFLEIKSQQKD